MVENAVQHAVRPNLASNKSGEITTHISRRDNQLLIVIEDNGPGIQHPEQLLKVYALVDLKRAIGITL